VRATDEEVRSSLTLASKASLSIEDDIESSCSYWRKKANPGRVPTGREGQLTSVEADGSPVDAAETAYRL